MIQPDAIARARPIKLVLFDVDGVLTDGTLWYMPDGPAAERVIEVKGFSAHDGIGIGLARRAGLKTGVITKRRSRSLALRARDLRMDFVVQGADRKLEALHAIWKQSGCGMEETCCMGDDIVDLPLLEAAGLAAAPADARPEVIAAAHFVADKNGGRGAARDLIEFILRAQGVLDDTVRRYLAAPESDYAAAKPRAK
jgi:3-deoxy-D-manno-octulosonate 8-phosphate phosphatase (KDO 8-P phosphatase)